MISMGFMLSSLVEFVYASIIRRFACLHQEHGQTWLGCSLCIDTYSFAGDSFCFDEAQNPSRRSNLVHLFISISGWVIVVITHMSSRRTVAA